MEEALGANEELQKTNKELQQVMRRQMKHQGHANLYPIHTQADPQPFSQAIMDELVPPHYMVPKITPFSGSGDLKSYLKALRAQMLILRGLDVDLESRGSNAVQCKMFSGTALQRFNGAYNLETLMRV